MGYSYYGAVLLDWIIERLANQKGLPDTQLGDTTFLQPGDQAIVWVYDTDSEAFSEVRQTVSR